MQRLMRDSTKTEPERAVQREFRRNWLISAVILVFAVLLFRAELNRLPNRTEVGQRTVPLLFQPVTLEPGSGDNFHLVGAWRLLADDRRFGGFSALASTEPGFIGLTDSGVVARFPRPNRNGSNVTLRELPNGPGAAGFKVNRDSEALVADLRGRGWWVAFENRNEVWLYDQAFTTAIKRVPVNGRGLMRNRGIEGMIAVDQGIVLFPERGGEAFFLGGTGKFRAGGVSGWVSDAASLPDGRLALINRQPTPIGLRNRLVILARRDSAYSPQQSWTIPVGRLDNVEGLAVELMPGRGTRIWLVTDNGLQQRRPTLLIAVEIRRRPARR